MLAKMRKEQRRLNRYVFGCMPVKFLPGADGGERKGQTPLATFSCAPELTPTGKTTERRDKKEQPTRKQMRKALGKCRLSSIKAGAYAGQPRVAPWPSMPVNLGARSRSP